MSLCLLYVSSDLTIDLTCGSKGVMWPHLEPGIGGKSPPVTEPQFTTGNRFRPWLIIAIR